VSAGFPISIKALEFLNAKPALTLGLPTLFLAGESNILMQLNLSRRRNQFAKASKIIKIVA
jgi:hypothetical protein